MAAQAAPTVSNPPVLAGNWNVDLSVKPDQPYTRPMQLTLNPDGTVSGLFYQSTIEKGRWKVDRGRTCASFRTSDGNGPYHTSVCLRDDHAEGQTWAENRNFLFNWIATRAQ
ncbi:MULTISPECIES: lipocalin-like domain-containing protein [unclassified Sphingomonas]|uniref:lipocalin-like domain-containing protein n=1 Tax=Sphingomonas sp. PvP015 TaxID=3156388 RepID=UPI0033975599